MYYSILYFIKLNGCGYSNPPIPIWGIDKVVSGCTEFPVCNNIHFYNEPGSNVDS